MMAAYSQPQLRGELKHNEPMSGYTSWRVGGPADMCYRPADLDDLIVFLQTLPNSISIYWIGLGSNLLVRDGGIRGAVILPFNGLGRLELAEDNVVCAGAGVTCAKVAKFSVRSGLVGAEFLAGIPGTMGGALAMNAGAFSGETWQVVKRVQTISRDGAVRTRAPEDYQIGYRTVTGPVDEWFVSAELQLQAGDSQQAQQRIKALLEQRGATQPTQQPSCGSVFRNPPGDHAARLIESCGLKGLCIGAAQVSPETCQFYYQYRRRRRAGYRSLDDLRTKRSGTTNRHSVATRSADYRGGRRRCITRANVATRVVLARLLC